MAESVALDCKANFEVTSLVSDRVQTGDWGTWRIVVDAENGYASIDDAVHFRIDGSSDRLIGIDTDAIVNEDEISFCVSHRACGVRLDNVSSDGWYQIDPVKLDRRRSTFHVRVERMEPSIGYHSETIYSGSCAPPPERKF